MDGWTERHKNYSPYKSLDEQKLNYTAKEHIMSTCLIIK